MYASAIPLALTYGLIFSPPEGLGQIGLFLWLTGFAILVRASMTLYHVPHMALGAELTSDYHERTVVVAYRSGFGALGIALVLGLGWSIFFPDLDGQLGRFDPDAYRSFGWIFGAIMLVSIVVSAWGTQSILSCPRPWSGSFLCDPGRPGRAERPHGDLFLESQCKPDSASAGRGPTGLPVRIAVLGLDDALHRQGNLISDRYRTAHDVHDDLSPVADRGLVSATGEPRLSWCPGRLCHDRGLWRDCGGRQCGLDDCGYHR